MAKNIHIICGHYGSGKTNISVNLALSLREKGERVSITDLDIVNPYFRASDSKNILTERGVRCIIPEFAGSNLDLPTIPPEVYSVFCADEEAVFDVGGDDAGAVALGMFHDDIVKNGYSMILVINMYRPLISTPELAIRNMRDIEEICGLKFTGIVNNSNLGPLTDEETVRASFDYADEVARLASLPLLCDTCLEGITLESDRNIVKIKNYTEKIW